MNYYPFHIGDYLSATRHLSWVEDMAYRRLLDTYYTTEKPLPVDFRACCRLVLATTDEQREAVRIVLDEFFTPTDDGWINSRADGEIQAMRDKQQKQRDKANKRWHKSDQERGNAPAMPRHMDNDAAASKSDADAMPPTPTPTPTPVNTSTVVDVGVAQAPPPPKNRQTVLPEDFYPNETGVRYAEERGINIAIELQGMRNWAESKRILRSSWQATWRTWCDKAVEFGRTGVSANGARASPRDIREAEGRRVVEVLTGKVRNEQRIERDITSEAVRLAG